MIAQVSDAIHAYFAYILLDGDYLNDWLTHIPSFLRAFLLVVGQLLAVAVSR